MILTEAYLQTMLDKGYTIPDIASRTRSTHQEVVDALKLYSLLDNFQVDNRVDTLETSIDTVESDIEELQSDVSSLDTDKINKSVLTAKGSILTGSAASTPSATTPTFPADEGKVVIARAASSTGLSFETVSVADTVRRYSGSFTGTGEAQNIAHGIGAEPNRVLIQPTVADTVISGLSKDETNITVTVTLDKACYWIAEVW